MNKNGRRLPQGDAVGSEGNGTTGNCLEGMVKGGSVGTSERNPRGNPRHSRHPTGGRNHPQSRAVKIKRNP